MPKTSSIRNDFAGRAIQQQEAIDMFDELHVGKLRAAPVHRSFVDLRFVPEPLADPPVARMLTGQGGRGGEMRLKTYLTLLWLAKPEYRDGIKLWEVDQTRETLGKLVGVYHPDTGDDVLDRRRDIRVRDLMDRTLRWLDEHKLIHREKYSSRVRLLDDRGTGGPYVRPGDEVVRSGPPQPQVPFNKENLYFKVPAAFWLDGWVGLFTADELAAYLCLLADLPKGSFKWSEDPPRHWSWWSQSVWNSHIRLKRDMRYSGFSKLVEHGIAIKESAAVHSGTISNRSRKKFALAEPSLDGRVAPMPLDLRQFGSGGSSPR